MKRLLAAVSVFAFLGFILGKVTGRPKTVEKTTTQTPPTIVHVHSYPAEEKPLEGRLKFFRRWLNRYRDILDPAFVLTVATVAAVASGIFAWHTNEINSDQRKLLERQTDIQASQALPEFKFAQEWGTGPTGVVTGEFLKVTKEGGLARNLTIEVQAYMTTFWLHPDTSYGQGLPMLHIPLVNYAMQDHSFQQSGPSEFRFGYAWNYSQIQEVVARLPELAEQELGIQMGLPEVRWFVWVSYQDYLGIERDEYYGVKGLFSGPDNGPFGQQLIEAETRTVTADPFPVSASNGEYLVQDFQAWFSKDVAFFESDEYTDEGLRAYLRRLWEVEGYPPPPSSTPITATPQSG